MEFPAVISLAINSSGDIFAGTFEGGGAYRSTDNGDNWTLIDNGLTNTYVTALAINSSNNIFAATFGGGAFRSTDNGDSWTALNTGVPNATFLSLAINASGYIFAGGDPLGGPVGVLRSTDNGDSWEPVNNGLNTGMASMRSWLLPTAPSLQALMATVCSVPRITETTGVKLTTD